MRRLQQEIIDALKVKPTIDVDAEIKRSINFMQSYLQKKQGYKRWSWVSQADKILR